MFLAVDEMAATTFTIIDGLLVYEAKREDNLKKYAPFAAMEELLIACVKNGADRQRMHEVLRELSMAAWEKVSKGEANPLTAVLPQDPELNQYMSEETILHILNPRDHVGDAPQRALFLVKQIRRATKDTKALTTHLPKGYNQNDA